MKIARFTHNGHTRLGVVDGDDVIDVGSADPSLPTDVGELIAAGGIDRLRGAAGTHVPLASVRLEAPIAQPPVFLAIGLNYADHIAESGMNKPAAPVVFNKQITCVIGPNRSDRSAHRGPRPGRLRG